VIEQVAELYGRIDSQIEQSHGRAGRCTACGACCDFPAYDHRLFVAPPELVYLSARLGTDALRKMAGGRCPYQENGRCTVHEHRFAGCRIFCCTGDPDFQGELSEASLRELKTICEQARLPYRYQDLATALRAWQEATAS
jgi:Fe-S-cluster containining protein